MKHLIAVLALFTLVSCVQTQTKPVMYDTATPTGEEPIMIGIPEISEEGLSFYQDYGHFLVRPFTMSDGIYTLGINGMICEEFGHWYDDKGVCRFCGAVEPGQL